MTTTASTMTGGSPRQDSDLPGHPVLAHNDALLRILLTESRPAHCYIHVI